MDIEANKLLNILSETKYHATLDGHLKALSAVENKIRETIISELELNLDGSKNEIQKMTKVETLKYLLEFIREIR